MFDDDFEIKSKIYANIFAFLVLFEFQDGFILRDLFLFIFFEIIGSTWFLYKDPESQ